MNLSEEILHLEAQLGRSGGVVTIATAESATGGRIADRLTNAAGSSDYFVGGIVAYSNEAKQALLGVRAATLAGCGAVSAEVACEMAEGARRALCAAIAISDTGIAGPGGATAGKPVGLFYLGFATADGCSAREERFTGGRYDNKDAAVETALTLLRDYLLQCCEARGANNNGSL